MIVLVAIHAHDDGEAVPLGAACIAAAIQSAPALSSRVHTHLIECGPTATILHSPAACADASVPRADGAAQSLAAAILAQRPDAVGFSLYCWNHELAVTTLGLLCAARPELIYFAGGPEAEAFAAAPKAAPVPPHFANPLMEHTAADTGSCRAVSAAADTGSRRAVSAAVPLFDVIFLGEAEEAVVLWLTGILDEPCRAAMLPESALSVQAAATSPQGATDVLAGAATMLPESAPSVQAAATSPQGATDVLAGATISAFGALGAQTAATSPQGATDVLAGAATILPESALGAPSVQAAAALPQGATDVLAGATMLPESAPSAQAALMYSTKVITCGVPKVETVASPWLSGAISLEGRKTVAWELVRGCPFACAYCYEGRGQRAVRRLPDARISAELALFVQAGVEQVFVLDPTFNLDTARALRILSLLRKKAPFIRWNFEARAELLDRDQARSFSRLNCFLQIGLQSAIPDVLSRVNRRVGPHFTQEFTAKIGLLDTAGLVYGLDLIYGLPGDTLEGFKRSLDFALHLGPNHLDIFPLAALPGTDLAARAQEWQLDFSHRPPYIVYSQPHFDADDMTAAASLAEACTLFYSRGRAVPWFRSALAPLNIRACDFLREFFLWKKRLTGGKVPSLKVEEAPHASIEAWQCDFLTAVYTQKGLVTLVPALLDLVRFNGAWSRALAECQATNLTLRYPVDLIAGPEILDIARFVSAYRQKKTPIRIAPGHDGPVITKNARDTT